MFLPSIMYMQGVLYPSGKVSRLADRRHRDKDNRTTHTRETKRQPDKWDIENRQKQDDYPHTHHKGKEIGWGEKGGGLLLPNYVKFTIWFVKQGATLNPLSTGQRPY